MWIEPNVNVQTTKVYFFFKRSTQTPNSRRKRTNEEAKALTPDKPKLRFYHNVVVFFFTGGVILEGAFASTYVEKTPKRCGTSCRSLAQEVTKDTRGEKKNGKHLQSKEGRFS